MSRRRPAAIVLGLAVAALGGLLAMAAPAAAAHRCHDRTCQATPAPQPTPPDPQQVQSTPVLPSGTPQITTPPPTMGPATGVLTTPSGLRTVPQTAGVLPSPHPAGDLTVAILLIIAGLAVTAVVAFVLAFAST